MSGTKSARPWKTHGLTKSREYRLWSGMIQRCHNPKRVGYERYGGRGLTVCDEWRGDGGFERFLAHVGPRPSALHSLDRIDNARGYEPGNVRWATPHEQQRNTSKNRKITALGVTLTLAEWAERTGLHHTAILWRLRAGWDPAAAVTQPGNNGKRDPMRRSSACP